MDPFELSYSTESTPAEGSLGAPAGDRSIRFANAVPTENRVSLLHVTSTRVCDRCILKKVKCDQKRPTCFRCLEGGWPCVYSCARRKPGPSRGSRRKAITSTASAHSTPRASAGSFTSSSGLADSRELPVLPQEGLLSQPDMPQIDALNADLLPSAGSPWTSSPIMRLGILAGDPFCHFAPKLEPDQERELLNNFFTHVHPSIPLFRKRNLLWRYESGTLSINLLLTILVVTEKILGPPKFLSYYSLENNLKHLLDAKLLNKEGPYKRPSLDSFHQACLLAFYAFHQYPGEEAWTRIGQLARKAYQYELHQIDNRDKFSVWDRHSMSEDELDEWRHVWWLIYFLDSYSNITTATPFAVESDSVTTALVTTSLTNSANSPLEPTNAISLPTETSLLWKTTKEIIKARGDFSFNMHIITTTLLRQAATLHRLRIQNPSSELQTRLTALADHVSAVRLALPTRYLNPGRNALNDESGSDHHARLISVLHMHAASIVLCLSSRQNRSKTEWLKEWQQTFEHCQDIISIVRQWDGQYFPSVDPAVCLIIYATLVLLHLHHCLDSTQDLQMRLAMYRDMLLLFLEQFASVWSLPKFLIMSFKKFSQLVSGPLSQDDIDRVLSQFEGHLHQRWLNFLSLTSAFENLNIRDSYQDLSSHEWDFSDLEAVTDTASWDDMAR